MAATSVFAPKSHNKQNYARISFAVAMCLLYAGLAAFAGGPASAPASAPAAGQALVDKVIAKVNSVETMAATITNVSVVRGREMARPGSFWCERPGKVRLEVDKPASQIRVIDGKKMLMVSVPTKAVSILTLSRKDPLSQVLSSRAPLYCNMLFGYPYLEEGYRAELNGKSTVGKTEVAVVDIYPNDWEETFPPHSLYIRESDNMLVGTVLNKRSTGEMISVKILFTDIVLNQPIDPEVFALKAPEDLPEAVDRGEKAPEPASAKKSSGPNPFVGTPMNEGINMTALDGTAVSTKDLKGKPYILDIWATWCGPCKKALPYLEQVNAQGAKDGLKVYCLSNETAGKVEAFLEKTPYKLNFTIDQSRAINKVYDVKSIPTTFAVDSKGIIRGVEVGFRGKDALTELVASVGVEVDLKD